MKYSDIKDISVGSLITFREYLLDRRENKVLNREVSGRVTTVIKPNVGLNSDEIRQYYPDLDEDDYFILSSRSSYRIVLSLKSGLQTPDRLLTIEINSVFMEMGLQELENTPDESIEVFKPETPGQMLGFNSYSVGNKFSSDL